MADDRIRRSFTVPVSPAHAFDVFTLWLAQWWPPEHTWSGEALQWIGIEPRIAGACFERGPFGFRCDFGRVVVWQPPSRLVLTWQIDPDRVPQPDPERSSEVEVCFEPEPDGGTQVRFEHRHFARHGERGADYRDAMDSERGWTHILDRYRALLG